MSPEQTFLGISNNSIYRVDPRLPENKTVNTTTEKGYVAVGSDKGDIRLFARLGIRAKTQLPSLGDPITANANLNRSNGTCMELKYRTPRRNTDSNYSEVHYLWIDSLCIKQGPDGDWKDEAKSMEDVYSSAYCTLAATSAVDSNAGFLKRDASSVDLQDGSRRHIYMSTDTCDFDKEVEQATLNKRAWVMQERLLSCRTVHFGARQIYFECGDGVYCEDMTRLTSSNGKKKYFKLDPNFPHRLRTSGFRRTISFLQSFLEDYSKRGLSKPTDRAVSISGLAKRIERALSCEARYGVFGFFFHRSLLWQRSDLEKTERIEYKESDKVPSWSWVAYPGGIKFIDLEEVDYGKLYLFNKLELDQEDSCPQLSYNFPVFP
ncbi:uncharacterized protein FFNC_15668 [Fusarium fujikuroi]|nr:uncharacterized protein FFNC_15668 [Fusarium fujikuroi]